MTTRPPTYSKRGVPAGHYDAWLGMGQHSACGRRADVTAAHLDAAAQLVVSCRAYRCMAGRLLCVHARNAHSNGPYRNRRIHQ